MYEIVILWMSCHYICFMLSASNALNIYYINEFHVLTFYFVLGRLNYSTPNTLIRIDNAAIEIGKIRLL